MLHLKFHHIMPILHICGILLLIYFYLKPMLGKYDEKLQK